MLQSYPILSKRSEPIERLCLVKSIVWFGFLKTIYFVFETFNVSLLASNQYFAFLSSKFVDKNNSSIEFLLLKKVVSSANNKVNKVVALGKSFMKIKNSKGPRTDP